MDKKELREQYKKMKPDMGVYIVKCNTTNDYCIESSKDIKSSINRAKFALGYGSHQNKKLQEQWNQYGENNFAFEVLDILEYDKEECKTDYTEDLAMLKTMWEDKLTKG